MFGVTEFHDCQYVHCSYNVSPYELDLSYENFLQRGHVPYAVYDGLKSIPCYVCQCQCKHILEFINFVAAILSCLNCNTFFKSHLIVSSSTQIRPSKMLLLYDILIS